MLTNDFTQIYEQLREYGEAFYWITKTIDSIEGIDQKQSRLISLFNHFLLDKNLSENHRNSVTFHFIRKWVVSGWPQNSLESFFSKNLSVLSKPFASLIISYLSQPLHSDRSKDLDLLSVFSGEFLMKIIENFIFEMHSTPSSNNSTNSSGSGTYQNEEQKENQDSNQQQHQQQQRSFESPARTTSKSQLEVGNSKEAYGRSIPNNKTYSTPSSLSTVDPRQKKSIERVSSSNGILTSNNNTTTQNNNNGSFENLNGLQNENDPISQANALLSHEQKLWIGIKENMQKDISRRHKSIITISSVPNPPSLATDDMLSFSCEHSYKRVWFYESILPEFTQRMEQLSIPLTTKLIFAGNYISFNFFFKF